MIRASEGIKLLLNLFRVNDAVLNIINDLLEDDLRNRLLVGLIVHDFQSCFLAEGLAFEREAT